MKIFPENYAAAIWIPFVDPNGAEVTPSQVKARLFAEDGALIVDFGPLPFDPVLKGKEIVVPASFNLLGAGVFEEIRILKVELVTAAGSIRKTCNYVVQGDRELSVTENSFMSFGEAIMQSRVVANIEAWTGATEEQQFAALIEAFNRIIHIPLKYKVSSPLSRFDVMETCALTVSITRDHWEEIDLATFNAFPATFKKALKLAQIIEANEILSGDDISRRHRAGIISETVGESSMMLRGGAVDFGASAATLRALAGFVSYEWKVNR